MGFNSAMIAAALCVSCFYRSNIKPIAVPWIIRSRFLYFLQISWRQTNGCHKNGDNHCCVSQETSIMPQAWPMAWTRTAFQSTPSFYQHVRVDLMTASDAWVSFHLLLPHLFSLVAVLPSESILCQLFSFLSARCPFLRIIFWLRVAHVIHARGWWLLFLRCCDHSSGSLLAEPITCSVITPDVAINRSQNSEKMRRRCLGALCFLHVSSNDSNINQHFRIRETHIWTC